MLNVFKKQYIKNLLVISLFIGVAVTGYANIANATINNPHPTPPDNSVTTAMLQSLSVTPEKINQSDTFTFPGIATSIANISNLYVTATSSFGATTTFNGVSYNWPSTQGATSTVLENTGNGKMAWSVPKSNALEYPMVAHYNINVGTTPIAVAATTTAGYILSYNNANSIGYTDVTATSYQLNLHTTTNNNSLIYVALNDSNDVVGSPVLTVDGKTMTLATTTINYGSGAGGQTALYYITGIRSGAHTILDTYSTSATRYISLGAEAFGGVEQINPIGNSCAANSNTCTLVNNIDNSRIASFDYASAAAPASGTDNVIRTTQSTNAYTGYGDSNANLLAGTYSPTFDYGSSSVYNILSFVIHQTTLQQDGLVIAGADDQAEVNRYMGFITATSTVGANSTVYFSGVLGGFSNLIKGSQYYLNTNGAISTTPGTITKAVGNAVDTTHLKIYNN